MKPEVRQKMILRRLYAAQQELKIDFLARMMDCSQLTIRRDLETLEKQGLIIKTTGGCIAVGRVRNEAYQAKVAKNFELKEAIGKEAANEVKDNSSIILNEGTTVFHVIPYLDTKKDLIVYTNSLAMVAECSRNPQIKLYLLGGLYQADLLCLGGALLEQALESIEADIVFIGTDAIDEKGQCLVTDYEVARSARMMLKRGRRKILLADATKCNVSASVKYATLADFDLWITAGDFNKKLLNTFKKMCEIKIVKKEKQAP